MEHLISANKFFIITILMVQTMVTDFMEGAHGGIYNYSSANYNLSDDNRDIT